MSSQNFAPLQLLTREEVLKLTTLSSSTLYREIRAGRFPEPFEISNQRVAWSADLIAAWLSQNGDRIV